MYLQIRSEIGTKLLYFLTYSGRHVADVVLKAGIRGSDQSKDKVINVMPYDLWKGVIRKLKTLTPSDIPTWTLKWVRKLCEFRESNSILYAIDIHDIPNILFFMLTYFC